MFSFIDLFAGTGGFRIPFDELGGECVFTSEHDPHAQQSYYANFGVRPSGDITAINPAEIPAHDILIGGFPCQPFSVSGFRRGFDDTRGTLFFNIVEILRHHRPQLVCLENVRNLTTHDHGDTFRVILNTLEQCGYWVTYKVLNSKDYGVPQRRNRIYIVGVHQSLGTAFTFPPAPCTPTRVGDVLETAPDAKYTLSAETWALSQAHKARHEAKGNGWGHVLVKADTPFTPTIPATYIREALVTQHGANPRKLTPREVARLQGFPDSYRIVVDDRHAYKQFGNAVSVPVVRSVASALVPMLRPNKAQRFLDRLRSGEPAEADLDESETLIDLYGNVVDIHGDPVNAGQ